MAAAFSLIVAQHAIFKSVRYLLTGRLPKVTSILLVESGTRGLIEGLIGGLRQTWGEEIQIDLVTCYATLPKGFEPHNTRVYRVGDYRGRAARGDRKSTRRNSSH